MRLPHLLAVLPCLVAVDGAARAAQAQQVAWYQYVVYTTSDDPRYVSPIPSCLTSQGRCFEVERDANRRMVRATAYRGGKQVQEMRYQYAGNDTLPAAYDIVSANGEVTEHDVVHRNSLGQRISDSSYTAQGTLTDYELMTYTDTSQEDLRYAADGKPMSRYIYTYAGGIVTRSTWYANDSTVYIREIDPATGLSQSRRKLQGNTLQSSNRYTYAPDGTLVRDDIYDASGNWYGAREYTDDLKQREHYKFTDGSEQDSRYTYDERRWLKQTTFAHNGTLICTFTYDRFPDGTIKRTLAVGPGGDLLAEYPNEVVDKVSQDGTPIDGGAATIYRKGNWW